MEHYRDVDPREEWKRGVFGWFLRIQGIVGTTTIKLLLASLSWWTGHTTIASLLALSAVFVALGLFGYRHFTLQRMESDRRLHVLAHNCRNDLAGIMACATPTQLFDRTNQFERHIVQMVADFFRERRTDPTISCAIRTARMVKNDKVYVTVARSDGMSPSREANSEPISINKGLPAALVRQNYWAAFIIPDIADAIRMGDWVRTKNDALPDVKTVMVSPINGFRFAPEQKRGMVGILYVTSRKRGKNVFRPCDTVPMTAIADILGLAYSIVCTKISEIVPHRSGKSAAPAKREEPCSETSGS